jgi:hypothetical protein
VFLPKATSSASEGRAVSLNFSGMVSSAEANSLWIVPNQGKSNHEIASRGRKAWQKLSGWGIYVNKADIF